MGKRTEQLARLSVVSLRRIFGANEYADMGEVSLEGNVGPPLIFCFHPRNAFKATAVSGGESLISAILGTSTLPEIVATVVQRVMVFVVSFFTLGALKDKAMHVGKFAVRVTNCVKHPFRFGIERAPRPTHQVVVIGGVNECALATSQGDDLVGWIRWLGNGRSRMSACWHESSEKGFVLPSHFISLIAFLLFALSLSAQTKQLGPVKMAGASKRTFGVAVGGTWTHISGQDCNASGALVCVLTSNPTQHNTVLVYIGSTTVQTAAACTDGASNAYTVSATKGGGATGGVFAYVAYLIDAGATANKTITCTGFGAGFHDIQASEFHNSAGTQVLDQVVGSADPSPSTPAILLPAFTPAVAGSLSFCGVLPNNGISSANAPWTLASNNNSASEYQLSTPASAQTANFTDTSNADNYATVCIVVKP